MPRRKGANYRKKMMRRRHGVAVRFRKVAPLMGLFTLIAAMVGGGIYSGAIGIAKIGDAVDRSAFFKVCKVVVRGNELISSDSILKRCGITTESKIYRIKTAAVSTALLSDPWIEKARCVKHWWGTVAIVIKERTPVALVNCGEIMLVDRSGVLLPATPGIEYDLPMISAVRTSIDGNGRSRVDSALIVKAVRFIERATKVRRDFFTRIGQLDIRDTAFIRCITSGRRTVIHIGYAADARQIRNLWHLLAALHEGADAATRIDMRFQNLAFVYREPS